MLANNESELRKNQRFLEKKIQMIAEEKEKLEEEQLNFNAE